MATGASVTGVAVESIAFGGAGALVLGGMTFPPLGAILFSAALGAFSIGSIIFFIIKLWEKQQLKALEYLQLILQKLNVLNADNLAFLDYMNKSEQEASNILSNMEYLKQNVKSSSYRYRKTNSAICDKAILSTSEMIECINRIDKIDIGNWTNTSSSSFSIDNNDQNIRSSKFSNSQFYIDSK